MSQKFRAYQKDSKYGLAVVTGGSSGIGKSIIEQVGNLGLASEVFNLSRRKPASFTIKLPCHHLKCDLSDRVVRNEVFWRLEQELEQRPDSGPVLLVNNAGFGAYGTVDRIDVAKQLALIEVNIAALVELTARLLPFLKQRGGAVVNIASTAAFQGVPQLATYAASKAFVLNWTLALNEELRQTPARALCVCPGPTRTGFFESAGAGVPGGHSDSPESVARLALQALRRQSPLKVTGWLNQTLTGLSSLAPRPWSTRIAAAVVRRFRQNESNS